MSLIEEVKSAKSKYYHPFKTVGITCSGVAKYLDCGTTTAHQILDGSRKPNPAFKKKLDLLLAEVQTRLEEESDG